MTTSSPEPAVQSTPRRLSPARILIGVAALLGFAVVFAVTAGTGPLTRLDVTAVHVLSAGGQPSGRPYLLWVVSVPSLLVCAVIVLVIAVRRRRGVDGVRAVALLAAANVLGQVLKKLVLVREPTLLSLHNTYPSGHMIAFASVAVALGMVLPAAVHRVYWVIAGIVLAVVAIELVHYGWHRPSDVLGSLLLVTGLAALAGRTRVRS